MIPKTRREFLRDVGAGVVLASVGPTLAGDLGFSTAYAQQGGERLTFGDREPLVSLMQETPAARLLPMIVERLRNGTALSDVVAAAALANARTFGGEDYIGFHTLMAIAPSYHMAQELPENRRALPVLKVLFRNSTRIQEQGGTRNEVLHPVQPAELPAGRVGGEVLRESIRSNRTNPQEPERQFAAMAGSAEDALNNVLYAVQDGADVHRTVLPYRCWDLMSIIGRDQAHTLLRQSVRFCSKGETENQVRYHSTMRTALPRVLDTHRLLSRELGTRTAENRWVEDLSMTIFRGTPEQAADAVGAALAEGFDPAAVSEAISLATNQLMLRDNGRSADGGPNKPIGSIHGDSIGVHACDSANAWRNLARVGNARNRAVCLVLGAYQAARDRGDRGGDFLNWQPYPREDARLEVRKLANDRLLPSLEDAIRNRSQIRAAALTARYLETNQPVRAVWDMLLRYAISEDGALHHEKFYRTSVEEYTAVRTPFKPRYLIALARVTASGHGYAAPGYTDACRLLGV
jgi:hypothetical protein